MDFIFYPELPPAKTGIILELKVGHSPEEALAQIKEKIMRFVLQEKKQKRFFW